MLETKKNTLKSSRGSMEMGKIAFILRLLMLLFMFNRLIINSFFFDNDVLKVEKNIDLYNILLALNKFNRKKSVAF